ncbi:uncharacterized protein LOC116185597 [Apis dorsata]|uniref:uncharacterized protein LOC116185597 n=1 Tax=Apis dorsata TaxID=7462 RepID=UPI001293E22D|nr:uncharacterized protein LOC116185597 [Apis dorsata]
MLQECIVGAQTCCRAVSSRFEKIKFYIFFFQKSIVIVHLLVLLGCCAAFPVKPEDDTSPLVNPIFLQEPTNLGNKVEDNSSPVAYILFLSKLDGSKRNFDGISMEKRNVVEDEDLEPAAGTYALRPLFVYRQQVAYRQRLRNSRQGNGF